MEQSDANSAYTLSELCGTPSYVRLPENQRPKEWAKYRDPVCPLRKAFYGHPDSGGYWEKHCEKHLASVGFKPVADWRSVFWCQELKLLLVVYVDDFKLAGPAKNIPTGWKRIRAGIKMDDPSIAGKYLGCAHIQHIVQMAAGGNPLLPEKGGKIAVRMIEYDMESFLVQCVERYQELGGKFGANLQKVSTPFLDETQLPKNSEATTGVLATIASK